MQRLHPRTVSRVISTERLDPLTRFVTADITVHIQIRNSWYIPVESRFRGDYCWNIIRNIIHPSCLSCEARCTLNPRLTLASLLAGYTDERAILRQTEQLLSVISLIEFQYACQLNRATVWPYGRESADCARQRKLWHDSPINYALSLLDASSLYMVHLERANRNINAHETYALYRLQNHKS